MIVVFLFYSILVLFHLLIKMSHQLQCLYHSFEGAGSIFIGHYPQALTQQILKKNQIKAVVTVTKKNTHSHSHLQIPFFIHISVQQEEKFDSRRSFESVFTFIGNARSKSNILICCSSGKRLSLIFLFAFLIQRYKYSVQYICRLYDKKIKQIGPSGIHLALLQKLNSSEDNQEEEQIQGFSESKIGKRIQRIRSQYPEFKKNGFSYTKTKLSKKQEISINPQKKYDHKFNKFVNSDPSTDILPSSTGKYGKEEQI